MNRMLFSIGSLQGVVMVITAVRAKVFAVLLGPGGFGIVATLDQLVTTASQFSSFSLPFTAMKFLSRAHSQGEERFRRAYSRFLQAMVTLAVLATTAAVIVVPRFLGRFEHTIAKYDAPVSLALLGIPAAMLIAFFINALAARGQVLRSILLSAAFSAALMVSGAIGCWLGGVPGLYRAAVPAATLFVVGFAVLGHLKMDLPVYVPESGRRGPKPDAVAVETALLTYLAVGSYSLLLLLVRYLSLTRLGEVAAGLLQADLAVSWSIGALLTPASMLYLAPFVNREIPVSQRWEAAEAFLPRVLMLYSLGALPVLLFPDLVLRVLYSGRFLGAVQFLAWVIVWQCLAQVMAVYQQLLIGLEDIWGGCVVVTMGGYLAAAVLCFVLVRPFGIIGIGLGLIGGAILGAGLGMLRLRRKYGRGVPKSIPGLVAFSVLGLFGVAASGRMTQELTWTGLIVRFLVAIAFLAGLWAMLPSTLRAELRYSVVSRIPWKRGRLASGESRGRTPGDE